MSRAFTKELDGSEPVEVMERPISSERNLVTRSGLELINDQIAELKEQLQIISDKVAKAHILRDLRYWQARLASAELTETAGQRKVVFGAYIKLENSGAFKTYRITGQDEADPKNNLLSYTSPLAQELLGKELGDEVTVAGQIWEICEITYK